MRSNAESCRQEGERVSCVCVDGWGGSNCGVNINDCLWNRCGNGGRCVDQVHGFSCICDELHEGLFCENMVNVSAVDVQVFFNTFSCQQTHSVQGKVSVIRIFINSSC